jgi:hypothetical protein
MCVARRGVREVVCCAPSSWRYFDVLLAWRPQNVLRLRPLRGDIYGFSALIRKDCNRCLLSHEKQILLQSRFIDAHRIDQPYKGIKALFSF